MDLLDGPLSYIEFLARDEERHPPIHPLHFFPNLIWKSIESKYSQFTDSKALSKSTLNSNTFFFIFLAHVQISLTISGPFNMLQSST